MENYWIDLNNEQLFLPSYKYSTLIKCLILAHKYEWLMQTQLSASYVTRKRACYARPMLSQKKKKKETNSSRKENSSVTTSKQRLKLIIEHVEKSKIQQTIKTKLEPYHHSRR